MEVIRKLSRKNGLPKIILIGMLFFAIPFSSSFAYTPINWSKKRHKTPRTKVKRSYAPVSSRTPRIAQRPRTRKYSNPGVSLPSYLSKKYTPSSSTPKNSSKPSTAAKKTNPKPNFLERVLSWCYLGRKGYEESIIGKVVNGIHSALSTVFKVGEFIAKPLGSLREMVIDPLLGTGMQEATKAVMNRDAKRFMALQEKLKTCPKSERPAIEREMNELQKRAMEKQGKMMEEIIKSPVKGLAKSLGTGLVGQGLGLLSSSFGISYITKWITNFVVHKLVPRSVSSQDLREFIAHEALTRGNPRMQKFVLAGLAKNLKDNSVSEKEIKDRMTLVAQGLQAGVTEVQALVGESLLEESGIFSDKMLQKFFAGNLAKDSPAEQEFFIKSLCAKSGIISQDLAKLYLDARNLFYRANPYYLKATYVFDIANNITKLLAISYELTSHGQATVKELGLEEKILKFATVLRHLIDSYIKLSKLCHFDSEHIGKYIGERMGDTAFMKILRWILGFVENVFLTGFIKLVDNGPTMLAEAKKQMAKMMGGGMPMG